MIDNNTVNSMLDHIVSIYGDMDLGLSITNPSISGGSIVNILEPTGASYNRASVLATDWAAAANRTKTNQEDIIFVAPLEDWGTIGYVVLYNGGTPVITATLTSSVNIQAGGKQVRIPAGSISISLPE